VPRVFNPDRMNPKIKEGFEVFLSAWGMDLEEVGDVDYAFLIQGFYLDQLVSYLAAASKPGAIIFPPGRN